MSGRGTLRYDGRGHSLLPGSVALLAPNRPHEYFTPDRSRWSFIGCTFAGAGSEGFAEYIRQKNGGAICGPVAAGCLNNIQQILELKSQRDLDFETIASELIAVMLHQMASVASAKLPGRMK